jgi:hypothetical protein
MLARIRSLEVSPRFRSAAVLVLAVLATVGLLAFLGERTPFRDWLVIPLGTVVAWQVVLNLAWLSAGFAITIRLLPQKVPRLERLCFSVAAGVSAFFVALYVLGALHLFYRPPAIALAALFIASGIRPLISWWLGQDEVRTETDRAPLGRLSLAALIVGVLGVGIIYLGAFSPIAVNFDATWIHLTVPEVLAHEGGLVPFSGDWVRELPLLASMIHVWDFLVPALPHPAAHWMMALHTEFALFLWTLVGLAAVVNWMIESQPVRNGWVSFMLFPGIFVYDSNLGGAADHVAAFFLPAALLLTVRAPSFAMPRSFGLWGIVVGAAVMTKYQAMYAVVPLAGILLTGFVLSRRKDAERRAQVSWPRAVLWLAGGGLAVITPPLLKNAVYHANPFYPLLQDVFTGSHPTVKDAPLFVANMVSDQNWRAPAELSKRISEALQLTMTFAFTPHYSFVGNIPIFGFAFTLALPLLLVIKRARRLWLGVFVGMGALFFWGFTYRIDRNLQVFMPLLAATAGATLIRAWRMGRLAQVGVAIFVAVQVVWASDLYFTGQDQMKDAIALINSGRQGKAATRFTTYFPDHFALDRALPKDAVLLVHQNDPELGFPRRSYLDQVGWQGVIDYRTFATPRDLYDRLKALGVTHVVHIPSGQPTAYLIEEAIFNSFVFEAPGPKVRLGAFEMFPMPATPPPTRGPLQVLTLGTWGYIDGLYPVTALDYCSALPASLQRYNPPSIAVGVEPAAALAEKADVILVGNHPPDAPTADLLARSFRVANAYGGLVVHVRVVPLPPATK